MQAQVKDQQNTASSHPVFYFYLYGMPVFFVYVFCMIKTHLCMQETPPNISIPSLGYSVVLIIIVSFSPGVRFSVLNFRLPDWRFLINWRSAFV